jgi:glucuronoarabinoxylan endo-1,4-beta-xylanase
MTISPVRRALCAAVFSLGGFQQSLAADVTVDLNKTFQTIRGFGGMQDRGWTGYNLMASDRNLAYGNGPGQIGLTIMRIRVNPSSSSWSIDLPDAKDVISRGGLVFATPWDPPGANNSTKTAGSFRETYKTDRWRIKASMYNDYAKHLNDFITHMKNNGVALNSMSIQNEPDWDVDWTGGTGTDMYNITKAVCPQIQNTKCMGPESFSFSKAYYDPILNDAAVLKDVDMFGTHFYGTFTQSDAFFDYTLYKQKGAGKEFWMTEVYTPEINNQTSNTWPLPLDVSLEINRAFTLGNMSAYVWWYLKRSYGPLFIPTNSQGGSTAGTVSKMGFMMAQYAKYVRPGAVRVDATRKPQTDVLVSAYKKADTVVVVVLNKTTSVKTLSFAIAGLKSSSGAKITTSQTKSLANDAAVTVSGGNFSTSFDAQSTTTMIFVGNTAAVAPKVLNITDAPAGEYKVYDLGGALVAQVAHAQGNGLDAEIRRVATKPGFYFAKSTTGSETYKIAVEASATSSRRR